MKRFFLLLPVVAAVPLVVAVAAPALNQPKAPTAPISAPPAPGVAGEAPLAPKPQLAAPATQAIPGAPMAPLPGHDHDHEGEAGEKDDDKPKDPMGDSLDYLWKQSDVAFHAGDYPTAVKIHRAIVTLDPTDTESFGVGAWLLWSLGQKPQARAFIAQGLAANPKSAPMWTEAGEHYDLVKAFPEAKKAYMRAIELSGKKPDELLRRRLAHAAEHAGDLTLSETTWTALVRDYPASPVAKNNLARVKALRAAKPKAPVTQTKTIID